MTSILKIIYCDGSSLGNPGRGGFGVVALDTEKKLIWEYGGGSNLATNNQMELMACLTALKIILKSLSNATNDESEIKYIYELRLDSKYVIQGVTEWSKGWVKNGWKNSQRKEVVNKNIWQEILKVKSEIEELSANKKVEIKWTHVYGHTGERWNERVDEIAKSFAAQNNLLLKKGERYV